MSALTAGEQYNLYAFLMLFVVVVWIMAEYFAETNRTVWLATCQSYMRHITNGHHDCMVMILLWIIFTFVFFRRRHKQQNEQYDRYMRNIHRRLLSNDLSTGSLFSTGE